MRCICLHGAAHGVWKDTTAKAVDGREAICEWKVDSSVISMMVDMVNVEGKELTAQSPKSAESSSPTVNLLMAFPWMIAAVVGSSSTQSRTSFSIISYTNR